MEKYYAREDYSYAGDSIFTIPFPYIEKKHIAVFINDIPFIGYDFLTDYSIKINTDLVIGDIVSIRRNTPINERMVVWKNGSILKEESQNLADKQVIYAVQENNDRNEEFVSISETVKDSLIEIQEAKETCLETVEKVEQIKDEVCEQKKQTEIYIDSALDNVKDTTGNLLGIIDKKSNFVTRSIGEIVTSTVPLTDAGLHLLDGSLLQGGGVYDAFIQHMAKLYETDTETFCTEEEYQQSITKYGVCGKYVYDNENMTLRLPMKYNGEKGIHVVKEQQHTGENTSWYCLYSNGLCIQGGILSPCNLKTVNLAISYQNANYDAIATQTVPYASYSVPTVYKKTKTSITFDASVADTHTNWISIGYVEMSAYKRMIEYKYIVVANSTKTDIQVNIDNVVTDLNGKADTDLANAFPSQSFIDKSIEWGMPDYTAGVNQSANKSQRNNVDGWVNWTYQSNTAYGNLYVSNDNNNWIEVNKIYGNVNSSSGIMIPMPKGTYYKCNYKDRFVFYPVKGASR